MEVFYTIVFGILTSVFAGRVVLCCAAVFNGNSGPPEDLKNGLWGVQTFTPVFIGSAVLFVKFLLSIPFFTLR